MKFGPDGSMYVVDFGVIESNGKTYKTVSGTGSIWKISIQRSELKIFREKSMAVVKGAASAGDPDGKSSSWDPDYAGIQKSVQDYISGLASLGQEWGVFFKDLTSGKTFGVNEDLQVPAASTCLLYTSRCV